MNLFALLHLVALASGVVAIDSTVINATCHGIAAAVSPASAVYYFGSLYDKDVYHWASSSTQQAVCAFEPGTAQDIGIALEIIGKNRCPFAVKGGGHTTNLGFSSTPGVQIAMYKFSEVTYNSAVQTVTIGAGLIWDDVYAALEPYGVNVVGGRVSGIGVAGLTLGGGYSWLTNQYGLTIDTVQAFELVLPNGTVKDVTQSSNPSLFFALKGGYNNFGIVTAFTLKAFPQGQVWGGTIFYGATVLDQVSAATANFSANCTDPKAQLITSYVYSNGQLLGSELLFYDGPTPPVGIFDRFLAIPSLTSSVETRSFLSLFQPPAENGTEGGLRGTFTTVSFTDYPVELLQTILNETVYWGQILAPVPGVLVTYSVEPFLPTLFTHNTSPSAYPGSRKRGVLPLSIYYAWTDASDDGLMQNAARTSAATLFQKALTLGQDIEDAPLYPNYAIYDTPLETMYGNNVHALKEIRRGVDPSDVMGLAGGFKF